MCCEDCAEAGYTVVDEGFRVFSFVGVDELEGFSEEREAEISRWETDSPTGGAKEEVDEERERRREEDREEESDGIHNFGTGRNRSG